MSDRMPTSAALEQLREVIAILRELSNAGPRDQSFKQWRQVTLTLLQRVWPNDQGRAARFRRIPFSPPSSRADAKAIRECYERGCCEAIAYLEGLVTELESGASKLGRPLHRPAEAPVREIGEREQSPPAPHDPSLYREPDLEPLGAVPPFAAADPPTPRAKPAAPPPPPPPPAPPSREKPAPARADNGRSAARSKPRLKDMLGFSDEGASAATARTTPTPARPAPPAPFVPAAPPAPPAPVASSVPPPAPAEPFAAMTPPEPEAWEPDDMEPLGVEPVAEDPEWSAPVIPFPTHRVSERGRFTTYPAAAEPEPPVEDGDGAFDVGFEFGPDAERDPEPPVEAQPASDDRPPPATLREMLDRAAAPGVPTPSRAAREVLAMAAAVDTLGVPPQRRAIVCAALIDLGHQMEAPPVQWASIRQALAFMMDYPQIARRVIPMLMPYLDEAA